MEAISQTERDVAVPASIFVSLRRELEREVGPLPAVHALHSAGFAVGSAAAAGLSEGIESIASLPEDEFWFRLTSFFSRRGWGTVSHRSSGEALGLLTTPDWVEATGQAGEDGASCAFSAGFLSGLLSELAGGPIAVLEVSCRSRGDDACVFAFGSEGAVHEIYGRLLDGQELETALSGL